MVVGWVVTGGLNVVYGVAWLGDGRLFITRKGLVHDPLTPFAAPSVAIIAQIVYPCHVYPRSCEVSFIAAYRSHAEDNEADEGHRKAVPDGEGQVEEGRCGR